MCMAIEISGPTTANSSCSYGDNEDLIGQWFKANPEKREDIFLATKFAFKNSIGSIDTSPEHVSQLMYKLRLRHTLTS